MTASDYITGTISLTNGSVDFTGTGTGWELAGFREGDTIIDVTGATEYWGVIAQIDSNTAGKLTKPWEGPTLTDVAYRIRFQPDGSRVSAQTRNLVERLSVLDANGRGLFYNLIGVTVNNDPGPGNLAFNDVTPSTVTEMYLDVLDANTGGRDVAALIDLWAPGTLLIVRSIATTAYLAARVINEPSQFSGYRSVSVAYVGHDGMLAAEPVAIEARAAGQGIRIDAAGPFADRSDYDGEGEDFTFASVDGDNGEGPPTVLYIKQTATPGDWSAAVPFQGPESEPRVAVTVWDPGRPGAAEEVWRGIFDVPVSFPSDLDGLNAASVAEAGVAATAEAVYSLNKNGSPFGTLTFAPGVSVGVFSAAATDFAAGDVLSIVAPTPRDDTLARIAITLAGTR